ncbi:MAG: MFS transporter [Rhodospirillales bacterium]|jgi:MFS family permease|nr:MFS transporter [Rhodospirillales bacterium]
MSRDQTQFLLLNFGHFFDHLFMLVFATVAALALSREWGLGYGELLQYATPGFVAFGVCALPAGWLADKWSRDGMMCVFFVGIGVAAIAAGFSQTPLQIGIGLFAIGVFAAIYHPVGLAIVTAKWKNTGMRIAVNGVWGNLGVASAALITGYLIDNGGWRLAFIVPGLASVGIGVIYVALLRRNGAASQTPQNPAVAGQEQSLTPDLKALLVRISAIVFLTTAVSSVIFQATTFALPKIFDERLQGIAAKLADWSQALHLPWHTDVATMVGVFAFSVFAIASMAQLVVGSLLDKHGPRPVFLGMASLQAVFFFAMPGLYDGAALAVALGFMLGAFGQIPINDYMIGKMASGEFRARVYGVRYVVSFSVLAATLPLIAFVYENWGFDTLFQILAAAAAVIFTAVTLLPRRLPEPAVRTP